MVKRLEITEEFVFLPADDTANWMTKSKPLAVIYILFLKQFINFRREVLLKFPGKSDLACRMIVWHALESVWRETAVGNYNLLLNGCVGGA
jgi:hypothetical protein